MRKNPKINRKINPKIEAETIDEIERRLLRLYGCLAFVVDEAEKLGYPKTAIEARRAGLQLCYETGQENDLGPPFSGAIIGHG
jgi:hypothetical protein